MKTYEPTVGHAEKWQSYVPNYVQLYYVDYDDNLNEHKELLQDCVQNNSIDKLSEVVFDWYDYPEGWYMDEIEGKMEADGLSDEFDKHHDEIQECLWERDQSSLEEDLLRNTSKQTFFYSLGIDVDGLWTDKFIPDEARAKASKQSAKRICQVLGIKDKATKERIQDVCENASYGGELRIYFEMDVEDAFSDGLWEGSRDWQTIQFSGHYAVAVWDNIQGAGDFTLDVKLDVQYPFIRENLNISEAAESYNIESACGLCSDWLSGYSVPKFSFDKTESKDVKVSKIERVNN